MWPEVDTAGAIGSSIIPSHHYLREEGSRLSLIQEYSHHVADQFEECIIRNLVNISSNVAEDLLRLAWSEHGFLIVM